MSPDPDKPLRGVLIGCGGISEFHLRAWQQVGGADIVAVCDVNREQAEARAAQFGIATWDVDAERLLDRLQPDFVDIATRPAAHLSLTELAAGRGCHVLCQKPLADSVPEGERIVHVADQTGITFMVNENFRWRGWYRWLARRVQNGEIGEPVFVRAADRRWFDPGAPDSPQLYLVNAARVVVIELGIHYVDLLRATLGELDSLCTHLGRRHRHIVGEDRAMIMAHSGERQGLIDISWSTRGEPINQFLIEGDEGWVSYEAPEQRHGTGWLRVSTPDRNERLPIEVAPSYLASFVGAHQHFADCLREGRTPVTNGWDNLLTLRATLAVYESHETGHAIDLTRDRLSLR